VGDAWYYAEGAKGVGPVSLAELGNILSRVSGADKVLVWRNGFSSWMLASQVNELQPYLAAPPPLPHSLSIDSIEQESSVEREPSKGEAIASIFVLPGVVCACWLAISYYLYAYMWFLQFVIAALFGSITLLFIWKKKYLLSAMCIVGCIVGYLIGDSIIGWQFDEEAAIASGFSSAADMHEAYALGLTPAQLAKRRAEEAERVAAAEGSRKERELAEAACRKDWSKCVTNEDVVEKYSDWSSAQYNCREAANKQARYGTPEWSSYYFSTYMRGTDYVKTGIAVLIEKDALFQNGFGAKVHSQVIYKYDLQSKTVIDVGIFAAR
jgi:hypothetical protein